MDQHNCTDNAAKPIFCPVLQGRWQTLCNLQSYIVSAFSSPVKFKLTNTNWNVVFKCNPLLLTGLKRNSTIISTSSTERVQHAQRKRRDYCGVGASGLPQTPRHVEKHSDQRHQLTIKDDFWKHPLSSPSDMSWACRLLVTPTVKEEEGGLSKAQRESYYRKDLFLQSFLEPSHP